MIQKIPLNTRMSWRLISTGDSDSHWRQSVLCSYDIDDGELHLVHSSYFYILKRFWIVCIIQRILSSLLQTGISLFISIPCEFYANIDLTRYHFPSPQVAFVAIPNSTLINGLGRFAGGPSSPLAVVNVSPGKRYRFRLISISCDPSFTFSIDGHNMVSFLIWPKLFQVDSKRRIYFCF